MGIRIYFLAFVLIMLSCRSRDSGDTRLTIGVTYQNLQNEFVINIQDALRKRAEELNVRLIEVDGQGRAENQISQVENFLALDVDAIISESFRSVWISPGSFHSQKGKQTCGCSECRGCEPQ